MSGADWAPTYDEFPEDRPPASAPTGPDPAKMEETLRTIARKDFYWARPDQPGPRVRIGSFGAMARAVLGLSVIEQPDEDAGEVPTLGEPQGVMAL